MIPVTTSTVIYWMFAILLISMVIAGYVRYRATTNLNLSPQLFSVKIEHGLMYITYQGEDEYLIQKLYTLGILSSEIYPSLGELYHIQSLLDEGWLVTIVYKDDQLREVNLQGGSGVSKLIIEDMTLVYHTSDCISKYFNDVISITCTHSSKM